MPSLHTVNILFTASGKIGCNYSFFNQILKTINYNTHLFHQSLYSSLKIIQQTSLYSVVTYALGTNVPKQLLILWDVRKEINVKKSVIFYSGVCKVLNVCHFLWLKKKSNWWIFSPTTTATVAAKLILVFLLFIAWKSLPE